MSKAEALELIMCTQLEIKDELERAVGLSSSVKEGLLKRVEKVIWVVRGFDQIENSVGRLALSKIQSTESATKENDFRCQIAELQLKLEAQQLECQRLRNAYPFVQAQSETGDSVRHCMNLDRVE